MIIEGWILPQKNEKPKLEKLVKRPNIRIENDSYGSRFKRKFKKKRIIYIKYR